MNSGAGTEQNGGLESSVTRDLGLVAALAIGIGTMIAAGIFTLSGLAIGYVGSAAVVSFLLAAFVASFTALTYCEFTSIYPESGEGYLYTRKTFPAPMAFLVGWCLLLGYISSCSFYISSLSSYFNEFIWHAPIQMISGLVILAGLTLVNVKGTKETGRFQIILTAVKVVLLLWFILGGLAHIDTKQVVERFSTDIAKIGSTAALVFVTFFGFSAIAASAGEVRNPTKTIPRAIFIAMGLVTVLYVLVVMVILAAELTDYTEAAMGQVATQFLGSAGGLVIVAGAIFSMISASNASILAGSRVALSMSQLSHLPEEIGRINRFTRTPISAIMLVGISIGGLALLLPLEKLAHFANCILLFALALVNAALIAHRRKFPKMERPFRVPLVPVLPALGIAANLYLLTQIPYWEPIILAAMSLVLGFLGFLAWKGSQPEEIALPGKASRVALERTGRAESNYRVLVPIANPANIEPLIDLASAIASKKKGEIVVLSVVVVPDQIPPNREDYFVDHAREMLEQARERAVTRGIPASFMVRIGHNAARAILETTRERDCDLILLGWKGHTTTARRMLGETTDDVVNHARADIILAKLTESELPRHLLLPTAGGEHAQLAQDYAAALAHWKDGSLMLCSVLPPQAPQERVESEEERLLKDRARLREKYGLDEIATRVIRNKSVRVGVLKEAEQYDGIVLGAAGQSFATNILFGSIPEDIARRSKKPVLVVKRHSPVKALLGRVSSE